MNIENLKQDYPEMPDYIGDRIKKEVEEQIYQSHPKRFHKMLLPLTACFILLFGGVAFAKSDMLRDWLSELGPNANKAEKIIESNMAETNEDWLKVKDVYVDGMRLVFVAELNPEQEDIPVDMADHCTVDGVDCLTDQFETLGDGLYEGRIILSDALLQEREFSDMIEVCTNLYIGDNTASGKKRAFSFSIPSENMYLTTQVENDAIKLYDTNNDGEQECIGTVVGKFTISPSTIFMKIHYEFTGENAKAHREEYFDDALEYDLVDDKGVRKNILYTAEETRYDNVIEQDDCCSGDLVVTLHTFDTSSKTITIIPVSVDYFTEGELEGKRIDGTEIPHEDRAITFVLNYE